MNKIKLITLISLFLLAFSFNSCENEPVDPALLIQVPDPVCNAPITFTVSNFITGNSVNLSWTSSPDTSEWEIEYGLTNFIQGTGTKIRSTTTLKTITSLDATKTYHFYIRTRCDVGFYSNWIGPVSVGTTATNCSIPSTVTAVRSPTIETQVTVSWLSTGNENSWEVQYGNQGFVIGNGTTIPASTNSKMISGLLTNSYDFYVRSKCSVTSFSNWVGPINVAAVGGNTCISPTNLTAIRATNPNTQITINWTAVPTINDYEIQYGATGFAIGNNGIIVSATGSSKIITGLQTTAYDFYVRTKCSSTSFSNWVGPVSVAAVGGSSCAIPTNLTAIRSTNTNTEITVNWTVNQTIGEYEIQYGATGFAIGTGTIIEASNGSRLITGLQTTGYDFYIRSRCSTTSFSNWVGPVNVAASSVIGTYYMRMKIDGTLVNFPLEGTTASYTFLSFMIQATNGNDSFVLQVDSPTGLGTYPFDDTFCVYAQGFSYYSSSYSDFTNSPGNIIITELNQTNNTIKGTFNFIGKNDTMTQSKTITEGAFYLPYQ